MESLTVQQLAIYPIKSCQGISLSTMALSEWGPDLDRRFMLVDPNGKFVTARQHPKMLAVRLAMQMQGLLLSAPGMSDIAISLSLLNTEQSPAAVKIWKDSVTAIQVNGELDEWFSDYLGVAVRLVFIPENSFRQVDQNFYSAQQRVSFADGFPLLITHQTSLEELNSRLEQPVTIQRFRPNIVIAGGEAWAEDRWKHLQIGQTEIELVKPCSRCVMTTIDPLKLEKAKEPLSTLSQYRRTSLGVIFGQNGVNLAPGLIQVGDPIVASC